VGEDQHPDAGSRVLNNELEHTFRSSGSESSSVPHMKAEYLLSSCVRLGVS
jgi:hypothetical protein